MIWKTIFGRAPRDDVPYEVYGALVAQARLPRFYSHMGVPDTVEGRFEMVALHAYLVLRHLRAAGGEGKALGQKLFDILFDDMDQTLREMGVGDLSVGKKIKALASSFYGRIQAYDQGLAAPENEVLEAAIRRNIFGGTDVSEGNIAGIASYVRQVDQLLVAQPVAEVMAGRIVFGMPESLNKVTDRAESQP